MKQLVDFWNRLPKSVRVLLGLIFAALIESPLISWLDNKLGINDAMIDKVLHQIIGYGIPAATVLIFLVVYHLLDYIWFTRWKNRRAEIERISSEQEGELVPMPVAARLAYEEARKVGSLWAYAAESDAKRARDADAATEIILSFMANLITGKVPVFGVSPPSERMEEIDLRGETGVFQNKGSDWGKLFGNRTVYSKIQVKKSDLEDILEYLRNSHKADAPI